MDFISRHFRKPKPQPASVPTSPAPNESSATVTRSGVEPERVNTLRDEHDPDLLPESAALVPEAVQNGKQKSVMIALMGVTGAGKSTFISHCVDNAVQVEIGHSLTSCTQSINVYELKRKGVIVYLIDTPGFDDSHRNDVEVLQQLASWLKVTYEDEKTLDGIIYLHRISDVRMQGSAAKNLRIFKDICGQHALKSVVLATTRWEEVSNKVAEGREKELKETEDYWGDMIKGEARVVRHKNNHKSALRILDMYLPPLRRDFKQQGLEIQREMVPDRKDLPDTRAAKTLDGEMFTSREQLSRTRQALEKLEGEAVAARLKEVDDEIKMIEEKRRKLAAGLKEYEGMGTLRKALRALFGGNGRGRDELQKEKDAVDQKLDDLQSAKSELKKKGTTFQMFSRTGTGF
ncbi:hypothetical protein OQA88_1628 [Cercophora sp. LCS_1]